MAKKDIEVGELNLIGEEYTTLNKVLLDIARYGKVKSTKDGGSSKVRYASREDEMHDNNNPNPNYVIATDEGKVFYTAKITRDRGTDFAHISLIGGNRDSIDSAKRTLKDLVQSNLPKRDKNGVEWYEKIDKVTPIVLGISGVGLLLMFGNGITGGAIGVADGNIIPAIIGSMFIVSSLVLFFKRH